MNAGGVFFEGGSGDEPYDLEESMDLSELLGALKAPGTPDELAHADSTVAAMAAAHAEAATAVVPPRRIDRRPALVAVGTALGIVSAVLVTGTAAAAFSGALPANLQRVAHDVLGAPAPSTLVPSDDDGGNASTTALSGASEFTERPSSNGSGPAASLDAKALFGLCTAFADNGADDQSGDSVAFKVLSEAASANDQTIEELCAPILASKPGGKPTTSTGNGQGGKPSTPPGQANKPSTPPGQTKKPSTPPGQTRKPTTPAPQASSPGNKPSTPPGQTRRPTSTPR